MSYFWWFPLLMMGLCLVMMLMMMRHCGGVFIGRRHGRNVSSGESSREILDRRYARGDLTKAQYDAMLSDIENPAN
jgi:putative membrane protein